MARVQTTLKVGSKTAQDYSALISAIHEFSEDAGDEGVLTNSEGNTIQRATQLAIQAREVAKELNLLLENLGGLSSPEDLSAAVPHIQKLLITVKQEEHQLIGRAFVIAANSFFWHWLLPLSSLCPIVSWLSGGSLKKS